MRTKRQRLEHQGALTEADMRLAGRMTRTPSKWFTTLEICRITGRVSARDVVRKLQAAGVPIGPAKLLRTNENGSRIYGWRVGK